MKRSLLALALAILSCTLASARELPRYAVAIGPTPVLNTPSFRQVFGGQLRLDPCKGVRPVEFVALTGTLFRIEGEQQDEGLTVYRVTSNDYPYRSAAGYFVDARFLKPLAGRVRERPRSLPGLVELQQRLLAALGRPYVWGGNVQAGVPLLKRLYPRADPLAGVDCSGLLYQATDGFTPRNSLALTSYGAAVPVAGLTPAAIAERLQPLDLIVWKGHVMIVLDKERVIESRMGCQGGGGVQLSRLQAALQKLMKSRQPMDELPPDGRGAQGFVVRRWFAP